MRIPLIAFALILTACSGETSRSGATVSDSAGIMIVSNDYSRPGWRREERWTLAVNPSIQIGNVLGDPTQQLYQVAQSRRLQNGGVVVANTGLGDVRLYDARGYHVRTIDVGDPVTAGPLRVYELDADSILVYQADGSLSVFDSLGQRVGTATLAPPRDGLEPSPEPLGVFEDGTMLFRARHPRDSTASGVGRRKARLLRHGLDGELLGSLGDFDNDAVLFEDRGGYIFGPTGVAAAADSTVWYGGGDRYELREVAPDGRTLRIVRLDRPGIKVLQADVASYRRAATNQVRSTPRESTIETTLEASIFADTFPVFDRIIVDAIGDLWVRNYQWFDLGSGKNWTVFDHEGRYLGEVTTPSILEIHQIGADYVLGRMSDGRGREAVYIFVLEKPGSVTSPITDEEDPADR